MGDVKGLTGKVALITGAAPCTICSPPTRR